MNHLYLHDLFYGCLNSLICLTEVIGRSKTYVTTSQRRDGMHYRKSSYSRFLALAWWRRNRSYEQPKIISVSTGIVGFQTLCNLN